MAEEKKINPLFKGMRNAKISESGKYLPAGTYTLKVKECKDKKTRAKGEAFIVDFIVETSDTAEVKPGEERNWYQSMKDPDVALSNLKAFAYAIFGHDPSTKEGRAAGEAELDNELEATMTAATEENAFKDLRVKCVVDVIQTKGKGEDFNRHRFFPA